MLSNSNCDRISFAFFGLGGGSGLERGLILASGASLGSLVKDRCAESEHGRSGEGIE